MTARGKRIALIFAGLILFLLPKDVECGFPDGECGHPGVLGYCKTHDLEPLGFYLIERLAHRDVGFAYTASERCQ